MKQYWLFICPTYYPKGGILDFYSSYDTIEGADIALYRVQKASKEHREIEEEDFMYQSDLFDARAHIFDSSAGKIIRYYDHGKWSDTSDHTHSWFPKTERF